MRPEYTHRTMAAKSKALTKPQFIAALADATGLAKTQVAGVLDAMVELVVKQIRGPAGKVTIPGVGAVVLKRVAAKPARMGRNPATGETIQLKPKPASKTVKLRPVKALKDSVL